MKLTKLSDYVGISHKNKTKNSEALVKEIIDHYLYILSADFEHPDSDFIHEVKIGREWYQVTDKMISHALLVVTRFIKEYYYLGVFTVEDVLKLSDHFNFHEMDLGDWLRAENDKHISEELEDQYLNG